ncbi:hypothetical protein G6F56_014286 [Rhizopus delemar]|nr:hypothetical protein G6F56_014286 [Rhizopus delemar]
MLLRKLPAYPSQALFSRWSLWWPVVCQVLLEIEQICHPEGTFTGSSIDTSGSLFLDKIRTQQPSTAVDRLFFDSVQD